MPSVPANCAESPVRRISILGDRWGESPVHFKKNRSLWLREAPWSAGAAATAFLSIQNCSSLAPLLSIHNHSLLASPLQKKRCSGVLRHLPLPGIGHGRKAVAAATAL